MTEENNQLEELDSTTLELLEKISGSRKELEEDLVDVRKLKDKLETLFPTELNFRNKHILEEKIKTVTGFYSTILNYRQEINKSLTSEIEIRRRLNAKGGDEQTFNIRELAHEIEEARSQKVVFEREKESEYAPEEKIEKAEDGTK